MTVPRFWREIPERYTLQATRCGNCQAIYFPAREVCPTCRRASIRQMQTVKLSGKGAILEWTRVHRPAPGYHMQVPYILALIRTDEGPVVTGQIVEAEPGAVTSGARVEAVFRRLGADGDAGVIHYGTKWQLTGEDSAPKPDATPAPTKRRLRRRA